MKVEDYILRVAKETDIALVMIGRTAGEDQYSKN